MLIVICEQIKTGECLQIILASETFMSGDLDDGFMITIIYITLRLHL